MGLHGAVQRGLERGQEEVREIISKAENCCLL